MDYLSRRGRTNITKKMTQLLKAMLEDTSNNTEIGQNHEPIDLSMAENWLITEEVLAICKPSIEEYFDGHVNPGFHFICDQRTTDTEDPTSIFPCLQISGVVLAF